MRFGKISGAALFLGQKGTVCTIVNLNLNIQEGSGHGLCDVIPNGGTNDPPSRPYVFLKVIVMRLAMSMEDPKECKYVFSAPRMDIYIYDISISGT